MWGNRIELQERKAKYAGRKDNFCRSRQSTAINQEVANIYVLQKIDYMYMEPCTVSKTITKNTYKQDLLSKMQNHNIVQVSLLDHHTLPIWGEQSSEPEPVIVGET